MNIAKKLLISLESFVEKLKGHDPIPAKEIKRHHTPDGSMHTFRPMCIRCGGDVETIWDSTMRPISRCNCSMKK